MQDHNTAETSRVHLRSVALHRQLHQRDCFNCAAATINRAPLGYCPRLAWTSRHMGW